MRFEISELERRVAAKLIRKEAHPDLPLLLWNYTEDCMFAAKNWDYYTKHARGLVTDLDGNVVALPFIKFFNMGEREDTMPSALPNIMYETLEKVDGSLIISYDFDGKVMCNTRGVWGNDYADKAYRLLQKSEALHSILKEDWTFLFELTYPGNGVVDYGMDEQLHILGAINRNTGEDLHYDDVLALAADLPFRKLTVHDYGEWCSDSLDYYADYNEPGTEGWVVRFANGMRVKIKTAWYWSMFRAHHFWSPSRIIDILMAGELDLSKAGMTATEKQKMLDTAELVKIKYNGWEEKAKEVVASLPTGSRKEQAAILTTKHQDVMSLCFSMLSGKDYRKQLWERVREEMKESQEGI